MIKKLLPIIFLFTISAGIAQKIDRVSIDGVITAPKGESVEGINVYNSSSQKGTVTDIDGKFSLAVAKNDRVLVTAIQYQSFTIIIDYGVVDNKRMAVYLNPAINQLEEVIVRPYDLTGNVIVDVRSIKTSVATVQMDLSYETLEFGYKFRPDRQTKIQGNAAEAALNNEGVTNGINLSSVIGLFFKKKPSKKDSFNDSQTVDSALQQRFPGHFINEHFGVPVAQVSDFLYFAKDNGLEPGLLKTGNEMQLLEFLSVQSKKYLEERGE